MNLRWLQIDVRSYKSSSIFEKKETWFLFMKNVLTSSRFGRLGQVLNPEAITLARVGGEDEIFFLIGLSQWNCPRPLEWEEQLTNRGKMQRMVGKNDNVFHLLLTWQECPVFLPFFIYTFNMSHGMVDYIFQTCVTWYVLFHMFFLQSSPFELGQSFVT